MKLQLLTAALASVSTTSAATGSCSFADGCTAANPLYVQWLEGESVLFEAAELSKKVSGQSAQWNTPYGLPRPLDMVNSHSAWIDTYPQSVMVRDDESVLQTLGDEELWKVLQEIGINGIHTNPLLEAGGVMLGSDEIYKTIDGGYDPMSLKTAPEFGTDDDFKAFTATARRYGGNVYSDIVPGHEGKGADFRLAEMAYKEYPGIFTMMDIPEDDWSMLPEVVDGRDQVNLSVDEVEALWEKGYIPGQLQRVIFYTDNEVDPKITNYGATPPVLGVDGKMRRWVYMHYFKNGQPTLNWLDPSMAAQRLKMAEVVKQVVELGATGIRIDAAPFTGVETVPGEFTTISEGHPLSINGNEQLAMFTRKMGGFSFSELALPYDDTANFKGFGADMYYDFFTRPAASHALIDGNPDFLKLCIELVTDTYGIETREMVHALQNHDAIIYELNHYAKFTDEVFTLGEEEVTGGFIYDKILGEMQTAMDPYDYIMYDNNYVYSTFVGFVAAVSDVKDPWSIVKGSEDYDRVFKGMQVLTVFNSMIPGIFMASAWDMVGSLPLKVEQVEDLIVDGDFRWLFRGAYDMMGVADGKNTSAAGLTEPETLFGTLPEQLEDDNSYVRFLQKLLKQRLAYGIQDAVQVGVDTQGSTLRLSHAIVSADAKEGVFMEITDCNFAMEATEVVQIDSVAALIDSTNQVRIAEGMGALDGCVEWEAVDIITDEILGSGNCNSGLSYPMLPWSGRAIAFILANGSSPQPPTSCTPSELGNGMEGITGEWCAANCFDGEGVLAAACDPASGFVLCNC
jgi:maltose alpha-D-glucosyltransferase/alpha-amylase